MCNPAIAIGAATAALSIGQSVTQYAGQNAAAKQNEQIANLNYANQEQTIAQKAVQLDQEKSERTFDSAISSIQSQGAIANSASDQGLGASSIVQAINAGQFGIGRQDSVADINDQNARQQLGNESAGADITRRSTIMQKQPGNPISLALGVGQGVLSGITAANKAKKAGS